MKSVLGVLASLAGALKLLDFANWVAFKIRGTPKSKIQETLAKVRSATDRADAIDPKTGKPSDDVSELEDLFNR